jgi:hypothetical protein
LKKWLFWNGSLGLLHSQTPPLMIASMINISDLNFDEPFKFASSVLSIVIIVILALAIGLEIYVIHANKGRYQLEEFKFSYGTIIEGLNSDTIAGRYWNPLNLIRWALTIAIMVFLNKNSVAQIFILLVVSVIFQIIMVISNPMIEERDKIITWIIEISVSIYLYLLLSLTDFMGENTVRNNLGWALTILTGSVVAINILNFLDKYGRLYLGMICSFILLKFKKEVILSPRTIKIKPEREVEETVN